MELLDKYLEIKEQLFEYFGYNEDWKVIPIDDSRAFYWRLYGVGPGHLRYAETPELLDDLDLNYYVDEIYTQRFLPKWVYRGKDYTMVCVDTHCDGNQFLRILDNTKECPEEVR